jgi:hypothetical protein
MKRFFLRPPLFLNRILLCLTVGLIASVAIFPAETGQDAQPFTPAIDASPVIASAAPEGDPVEPFISEGDLWMSTWADDGNLYSGWGDGRGVALHPEWTDCGIAKFTGDLPEIKAKEQCYLAPTENPAVNDKPSSLLFLDGRLVGAFHSPLGDPWMGYLAVSKDYGSTWTRVGFYREGELAPVNASPWTRDNKSKFRCLFFINMGQAYALNLDGYVYALGMGAEWNWFGGTYLCRVPKDSILYYKAYRYFSGLTGSIPGWSASQDDAQALEGVRTMDQGSAMFHPYLKRYLFLTSLLLYDAPAPWGPWTKVGAWTSADSPVQWQGGYQPGIISKDTGPDWFWFTISGQNDLPKVTYRLHLGKMRLKLVPSVVIPDARRGLPEGFSLQPVFPNPFNSSATVSFVSPESGILVLEAFDLIGKSAGLIYSGRAQAGMNRWRWTPSNLATGVYLVRAVLKMDAGRMIHDERKLLLLK